MQQRNHLIITAVVFIVMQCCQHLSNSIKQNSNFKNPKKILVLQCLIKFHEKVHVKEYCSQEESALSDPTAFLNCADICCVGLNLKFCIIKTKRMQTFLVSFNCHLADLIANHACSGYARLS